MRQILFRTVDPQFHSLFNTILEFPPDGYSFVRCTDGSRQHGRRASDMIRTSFPLRRNWMYSYLSFEIRWLLRSVSKEPPDDIDLVFSAHRPMNYRRKPWVVMVEFIGDLLPRIYDTGHLWLYKDYLERLISSHNCKGVLTYLETERQTITTSLDCHHFEDKIKLVNLAVKPSQFRKSFQEDKVTLLFLGTVHGFNVWKSFEERGGIELLEAFAALTKHHDDLQLVIRSHIPFYVKEKYTRILKARNVTILDKLIPKARLDEIMRSSDIFLFPGHITPALTILDAMSSELPVIATDWRGNSEMVQEGRTGFLIRPPFRMRPRFPLTPREMQALHARGPDPGLVQELVEKTGILVEDARLRRALGRAGRSEIETGKFSIARRNKQLKRVFDEAIGR